MVRHDHVCHEDDCYCQYVFGIQLHIHVRFDELIIVPEYCNPALYYLVCTHAIWPNKEGWKDISIKNIHFWNSIAVILF